MHQQQERELKTFQTEAAAAEFCRRRNQGSRAMMVVVDGPADDFVCMTMRDAQDGEFMYLVYF